MNQLSSFDKTERPYVAVVAEPSGLVMNFVELLLANFCRVRIYSDKVINWKKLSIHLKDNSYVKFSDTNDLLGDEGFDYLVYFSNVFSKIYDNDVKGDRERNIIIERMDRLFENKSVKGLFVFPQTEVSPYFEKTELIIQKNFSKLKGGVGIVFVGQPLGPRMTISERDIISKIIKDRLETNIVKIPVQKVVVSPIFIPDLARGLISALFSFGYFGKRVSMIGSKYDLKDFVRKLKIRHDDFQVSVVDKKEVYKDHYISKEEIIKTDIEKAYDETLSWFKFNRPDYLYENETIKPKIIKTKTKVSKTPADNKLNLVAMAYLVKKRLSFNWNIKPKTKKKILITSNKPKKEVKKRQVKEKKRKDKKLHPFIKSNTFKRAFGLSVIILVFLIVPYMSLLMSIGTVLMGERMLVSGEFDTSKKVFNIGKEIADVSESHAGLYSKLYLGALYDPVIRYSSISDQLADIGISAADTSENAAEFIGKSLGDEPYVVSDYTDSLKLDLDVLYKKLSFLQGEIEALGGPGSDELKRYVDSFGLDEKRQEVFAAKELLTSLPNILGEERSKNYMVLFQNNMELRPTGGFIGSFSLVKFDKGRLVDISVFDVYSADGQLKGHVEPPEPIREYLNQATWYLRDSNWDPDYPFSAVSAEWFLDKEMDIPVDGVIAIDLKLIKDTIDVLGEVEIVDFARSVNSRNLYEVVQYEVESEFFPGSRKKANFLSALSKNTLDAVMATGLAERFRLAEVLYNNLEERHIQIYFDEEDAQSAISDLYWDGGVNQKSCRIANCSSDWFGIVEANLGVNKANYFVERSASVISNVSEESIERILSLKLKSNANPELGNRGKYKVYVRVMAPEGSVFSNVRVTSVTGSQTLKPEVEDHYERTEAGVLMEVNPDQEKTIIFRWKSKSNLNFNKNGEYNLLWRKQAGTMADPVEIRILMPGNLKFGSVPDGLLTESNNFVYNTTLRKDATVKLFW